MARKKRAVSRIDQHHVILRGTNRQEIFHDDQDRNMFLTILQKKKGSLTSTLYAWCLMGNHVHLLIQSALAPLTEWMHKTSVTYAMYYHKKYKTSGHLFQGRFKSEPVHRDYSCVTVVRYIHQNPVKAGMVERPDQWKWSSCRHYYGKKAAWSSLICTEAVLRYFQYDLNRFIAFNEIRVRNSTSMPAYAAHKKLTDDEAREKIIAIIGKKQLPHIKSMTKQQRGPYLRKIKKIPHITNRQAARILGISPNWLQRA